MNSIWTQDQDLSLLGMKLGTRMTIVDCGGGDLFLHSPVRIEPTGAQTLKARGNVRWVVAPNLYHHLYVGSVKRSFPEAKVYCAPGLEKKRSDFQFESVITNDQSFPWNKALDHHVMDGTSINEVVFFHRESRTLIVTDLALHVLHTDSFLTKLGLTLIGAYKRFGWSAIEKKIFIKDRARFQRSIEHIMAWDFDRVIMAHGTVVEEGGKRLMAASFVVP